MLKLLVSLLVGFLVIVCVEVSGDECGPHATGPTSSPQCQSSRQKSRQPTMGQYDDVRCKCICPYKPSGNGSTIMGRYGKVVTFEEANQCKCENVMNDVPDPLKFCSKCECKWERRNTTTIKVVVIIIICIVSLLVLYMLFLLCLDPLMSRRPKTYLEQHNEEDDHTVTQGTMEDFSSTTRGRRGALMSRVKHEVNRVKGEQEKWKGTVQEQRRHIYDRHTMLN